MLAEAMVKIRAGDDEHHTAAEGNGPVNALDIAARKALGNTYPAVLNVKLVDYKVRILDSESATAAQVRVLIESTDGHRYWTTVGSSTTLSRPAGSPSPMPSSTPSPSPARNWR